GFGGDESGFWIGGKFLHRPGGRFLEGSNWVDVAATVRDLVAIQSDGTLWVSEGPSLVTEKSDWLAGAVPRMGRFGVDTNWQHVINGPGHSYILLKRDGTLWRWGVNELNDKQVWPGLKALAPSQLGRDTDWARIVPGPGGTFAWKRDGTAWDFRI